MSSNVRQRQTDFGAGKKDEIFKGPKLRKNAKDEGKHDNKLKYYLVAIFICILLLISSLVVLFLNYPCKYYPVAYELPDPPKLQGSLAPNNILSKATRILEGDIAGPEFLLFHQGLLYTGTKDGKIVEITKENQMRVVTDIGEAFCGSHRDRQNCSRPLGLEFDADGQLIVCDAYLGILKVNVATGEVNEVLPISTVVDGRKMTFPNDVEITRDGDIYISESSASYRLDTFAEHLLHGISDGRLLKFDPMSGKATAVLNNLSFANGILLSEFQDYILVAETSRARIIKYHIKGINAGTTEVLIENLPCLPDNIALDTKRGSIWVPCSFVRHAENFLNVPDFLKKRTWLRRFLMELPSEKILHRLKHGAMLLEVSEKGQIKRAFMDLENKALNIVAHVAQDDGGKFYFGSYVDEFIAVLDPRVIPSQ